MGRMPVSEIAIWSAMLGGLLTLAALALGDALGSRSRGSMRNLLFVVLTGASCVVMTGLPEALFPFLPGHPLMVLKASLGPLAGGVALYYLGSWLGGEREDPLVHRLTAWGGAAVFLAAVVLALLASQVSSDQFRPVLLAAAVVNMVPVLLAMVAVIRATRRGDPLARWMLLAIVCLAAMVSGLYLRGLDAPGLGSGFWLFTAVITMLYFLAATVLGILRNRHNRKLARLSRVQQGADPVTGLHTGSALIAEVEHVFWRTARQQGECSVICVNVSNLYELTDSAGPGVEHQILVTLAARVRRAAGFRCVVGQYHPRCFVVVMFTDKHAGPLNETLAHLRFMVGESLSVVDEKQVHHTFQPRLGIGVVTHAPAHAKPMDILNEAERLALAQIANWSRPQGPDATTEHEIVTAPQPLR